MTGAELQASKGETGVSKGHQMAAKNRTHALPDDEEDGDAGAGDQHGKRLS